MCEHCNLDRDKLDDAVVLLRTLADLATTSGDLHMVSGGDLAITLRIVQEQIAEAVTGKAA